jgi:hypothetical protein
MNSHQGKGVMFLCQDVWMTCMICRLLHVDCFDYQWQIYKMSTANLSRSLATTRFTVRKHRICTASCMTTMWVCWCKAGVAA